MTTALLCLVCLWIGATAGIVAAGVCQTAKEPDGFPPGPSRQ